MMTIEAPAQCSAVVVPEVPCAPADVSSDAGLRAALARMCGAPDGPNETLWEQIGLQLLARAERDARRWREHASEFIGAYVLAGLELLKQRPERVLAAKKPWGLVVTAAAREGGKAVGDYRTGGLTARDATAHRVRLSLAPRIVSLDALFESGEFALCR